MQIIFSIDTEYGAYTDALNLPEDVTYSDAEIETMKQERLSNWIAIITAPPSEEVIDALIEDIVE
jgi:hypothetical protein